MKVRLSRMGNSRGVRLPKAVIEACGFGEEIDMNVEGRAVVLRAIASSRKGWEEAFEKALPAEPDDLLLEGPLSGRFDEFEWTW